ncbi:MAG: GrpB family protein [Actinomycetota bacterium]
MIGARSRRVNVNVTQVPYDPSWPRVFEEERARIARAFGDTLEDIEHIGSTAVEGLAAKPTIDIVVVVRVFDGSPSIQRLDELGYEYVPEYEKELPDRRYFRSRARGSTGDRLFHVHVYEHGHPHVEDHVAFRDHLRKNDRSARVYEALKSYLARTFAREQYTAEKSTFIRAVLAEELGRPNPLGPPGVILAEHDALWRTWFEEEKALLRAIQGDPFIRIEHTGSTSMPWIVAKPLIDIGATLASIDDIEDLIVPLARAGYVHRADIEATLPPRRFFVKGHGPAGSKIHLHIFRDDNQEFADMVLFRDWMFEHPEEARTYDELKRRLAATLSRPEYTKAKSPYILSILERARADAGAGG